MARRLGRAAWAVYAAGEYLSRHGTPAPRGRLEGHHVLGFGDELRGDVEPRLRRLSPGVIGHHDIWLVVHPDLRTSARVRAVMDFLIALLARERPLLTGRLGRARR